jgi:hypothetical protein
MLLAHFVEAFLFPGQTFSPGLVSCRVAQVAPLCLLGLVVRTGRLVGRGGINCRCHIVSDLFQTSKNECMVLVNPRVLLGPARKHGGAMMSIYTYRPIDLSIYLSVSINFFFFHFTYLFKDRYISIFFNSNIFGHYCATNHRSAFR